MDSELLNSSFPSTLELWAMNLARDTPWPEAHTSLAMGLIIQPVVPRTLNDIGFVDSKTKTDLIRFLTNIIMQIANRIPNIMEGATKIDGEPCFEPMFSKTGAYLVLGLKSGHERLLPGASMDPSSDDMRLQFQAPFFIAL
ncbi:hypothetical protein BHYA_0145g00270 [Botrytis hyacinthi]|uniref:Uncharacterized protein n=1 Tax=Botrytis hyacinthi TaxID=278943 RepID=A0A4Z1GGK7_9HELO|nr:hypothetical protein BHYA_0145g00270 [Botrytis hyacinthi]